MASTNRRFQVPNKTKVGTGALRESSIMKGKAQKHVWCSTTMHPCLWKVRVWRGGRWRSAKAVCQGVLVPLRGAGKCQEQKQSRGKLAALLHQVLTLSTAFLETEVGTGAALTSPAAATSSHCRTGLSSAHPLWVLCWGTILFILPMPWPWARQLDCTQKWLSKTEYSCRCSQFLKLGERHPDCGGSANKKEKSYQFPKALRDLRRVWKAFWELQSDSDSGVQNGIMKIAVTGYRGSSCWKCLSSPRLREFQKAALSPQQSAHTLHPYRFRRSPFKE